MAVVADASALGALAKVSWKIDNLSPRSLPWVLDI
jgi:hypothetical protein